MIWLNTWVMRTSHIQNNHKTKNSKEIDFSLNSSYSFSKFKKLSLYYQNKLFKIIISFPRVAWFISMKYVFTMLSRYLHNWNSIFNIPTYAVSGRVPWVPIIIVFRLTLNVSISIMMICTDYIYTHTYRLLRCCGALSPHGSLVQSTPWNN